MRTKILQTLNGLHLKFYFNLPSFGIVFIWFFENPTLSMENLKNRQIQLKSK